LNRGHSFLKLAKMKAISEATGKTVQPKIMKRDNFPSYNQGLKSAMATAKSSSHTSNGSSTSTRLAHPQNVEQANGHSNHTPNILSEQRRDIDRILNTVEGLQAQFRDMKTAIESLKGNKNSLNSGQDSPGDSGFTEEIELLTEHVSDISSKVHEVDELRLELRIMKRRVQRLEDGNMSTQSSHTVTGLTQDTPRAKFAKMTGSLTRRSVLSGTGASHPSNDSNFIGSSMPNAVLDSSTKLPAVEDKNTAIQQEIPVSPKNPIGSRESSAVDMQPNSPELSKLGAGRGAVAINTVPAHPVATLIQRVSIPETDVTSSTTISSTSQLSPIPAEHRPRPTTPTNRVARAKPRSATSLNNHEVAPPSDSEDDDYDPNLNQHTTPPQGGSRGSNRTRGSGRRHRRSVPVRLPTPEWEKPDWTGPIVTTSSTRGRGIMRRGVSGRNLRVEPDRKRRKTTSNDEGLQKDTTNIHDLASLTLHSGFEERSLRTSKDGKEVVLTRYGLPDARRIKRARDEHGRLLRPDGSIDRRSIRYKRGIKNTESDTRAASEDESIEGMSITENENNNVTSTTEKQARRKLDKRERGARDVDGFLLKPDGTRDGRSVRMIGIANSKAESLQVEDAHEKLMRQILGPRR